MPSLLYMMASSGNVKYDLDLEEAHEKVCLVLHGSTERRKQRVPTFHCSNIEMLELGTQFTSYIRW